MKKKMMALCLAGLMSVSVLGGIPFESDAAENEVVVEETTSDEGVVESLVDDNGDVLTAIVPYTEEEIRAREEAEGKIPAQFLENLSEYVPGNDCIADSVEADAAEMTPGIDNITPSTGNVKALVLVNELLIISIRKSLRPNLRSVYSQAMQNIQYLIVRRYQTRYLPIILMTVFADIISVHLSVSLISMANSMILPQNITENFTSRAIP